MSVSDCTTRKSETSFDVHVLHVHYGYLSGVCVANGSVRWGGGSCAFEPSRTIGRFRGSSVDDGG